MTLSTLTILWEQHSQVPSSILPVTIATIVKMYNNFSIISFVINIIIFTLSIIVTSDTNIIIDTIITFFNSPLQHCQHCQQFQHCQFCHNCYQCHPFHHYLYNNITLRHINSISISTSVTFPPLPGEPVRHNWHE